MQFYFSVILNIITVSSINISLDADSVSLGKTVLCTLKAITPSSTTLRPAVIPPNFSHFNIKDYQANQDEVDGNTVFTQIYKLQPTSEGTLTIEPAKLVLKDSDGNLASSFHSDSTKVHVGSMLSEDKQMRPNRTEFVVERDWLRISIIAACLLLFIAIVWVTIAIVHKMRHHDSDALIVEIPKRPAWEIALEELDILRSKGYIEEHKFMPFHVELSLIFRNFLENRFDFNAVEFTTTEIHHTMHRLDISDMWKKDSMDVLQICDLVKFADYDSSRTEMQHLLDLAEKLILEDKKLKGAA